MKEIYVLNHGDTVNKIKYEYKVNISIQKSEDKLFGYEYVDLDSGEDDVLIVRNYYPDYVYTVNNNDTIIDIMSRGFEVFGVNEITAGDKIILSKPQSVRYIVGPLETLKDISNKFGVAASNIIETNKLSTDKLFVGQILWI